MRPPFARGPVPRHRPARDPDARRAGRLLPFLLLLLLAPARPALAAVTSAERALAQQRFDEASALFARADYPAACPRFEESQRLDPRGGTLLNLAICHERLGRTAAAYSEFAEAMAQARRDGRPERVEYAEAHLRELGSKLSYLEIVLPAPPAERPSRITLDGAVLREVPSRALPVDPGPHEVRASWPDGREIRTTANVGPDGDRRAVDVSPPTARPALSWPLVLGGAGLAALAGGSALGLLAIDARAQAEERARGGARGDAESLNRRATVEAWSANVAFGVGLGALGAGAALYLLAKPGAPAPAVAVGFTPGGVALGGAF